MKKTLKVSVLLLILCAMCTSFLYAQKVGHSGLPDGRYEAKIECTSPYNARFTDYGQVVVSRSEVVSITLNNTTVRSFSGGTIVPHYNSSRQLTHFTASISIRDGQTTYYYEITISNR